MVRLSFYFNNEKQVRHSINKFNATMMYNKMFYNKKYFVEDIPVISKSNGKIHSHYTTEYESKFFIKDIIFEGNDDMNIYVYLQTIDGTEFNVTDTIRNFNLQEIKTVKFITRTIDVKYTDPLSIPVFDEEPVDLDPIDYDSDYDTLFLGNSHSVDFDPEQLVTPETKPEQKDDDNRVWMFLIKNIGILLIIAIVVIICVFIYMYAYRKRT